MTIITVRIIRSTVLFSSHTSAHTRADPLSKAFSFHPRPCGLGFRVAKKTSLNSLRSAQRFQAKARHSPQNSLIQSRPPILALGSDEQKQKYAKDTV